MTTNDGSLMDWLRSDTPWIALATLISGLALGWTIARRKRPARVVVREVARSSLVRVRADVRERIAIMFDGFPARNLSVTDMTIGNEGSPEIKHVTLDLLFRSTARVLAVSASASEEDNTRGSWTWENTDHKVTLHLPYLNRKESKQLVRFSIILDGDADGMIVQGGDAGWWVTFVPMPSAQQEQEKFRKTVVGAYPLMILVAVYVVFLSRLAGTPSFTARSLLISAPPFLLSLGILTTALYRYWRLSRVSGN